MSDPGMVTPQRTHSSSSRVIDLNRVLDGVSIGHAALRGVPRDRVPIIGCRSLSTSDTMVGELQMLFVFGMRLPRRIVQNLSVKLMRVRS